MVLNNMKTNTIGIYTYIHNQNKMSGRPTSFFHVKYDSAKLKIFNKYRGKQILRKSHI